MLKFILIVIALTLINGCSYHKKIKIPEHYRDLKNLTIYPKDVQPINTIQFKQDKTFGSGDTIMIGRMAGLAVDSIHRVFIGDAQRHIVHIFKSNGNYLTHLGRPGRGPGEYVANPGPNVISDKLYVYDAGQLRCTIYSLDSLSMLKTMNIAPRHRSKIKGLERYYLSGIRIINDQTFMAEFSLPDIPYPANPLYHRVHYKKCYLVNDKGKINPNEIFKLLEYKKLTATIKGKKKSLRLPFLGYEIMAITNDHHIYVANTTDFLIREYNLHGNYQKSFYYPVDKRAFSRDEALNRDTYKYKSVKNFLQQVDSDELPEYWPVLYRMTTDDQNRLWVATCTNDEHVDNWWVLNKDGKLLARFDWPRSRRIEEISDGNMYTIEKNDSTGIEQAVRYRIQM